MDLIGHAVRSLTTDPARRAARKWLRTRRILLFAGQHGLRGRKRVIGSNVLPYWLLFTFSAAGALEHRRRAAREFQGGPLLMVLALVCLLMIGLRWEVGGDWENYLRILEYFRYREFTDSVFDSDPGFSALNWLALRIGGDIWFVNLVCAAIFTWGLVKFARQQPNPWLVFVVAVPYLVIVVGMGYTRQAAAIGFILAALSVFNRQSLVRFAVYIAFAATFHKTAIVILPLVGLSIVTQRGSAAILVMIAGLLLYVTLLQDAVDRLLQVYVDANYDSQGALIRVAMNLPPAAIFLMYHKNFALPEELSKLWRIISLAAVGALGLLFTLESSTAVDRLALYLIPVQLFVLSRLPYAFPERGRPNGQIVLAVIAYSALVQFVWLNYAQHSSAWLPYEFYPVAEEVRRPLVEE
jgi:hypothetical protein